MRYSPLFFCVLLFASSSVSADILLFKRTNDDIKPAQGVDVQVWLTDAVNLVLRPINKEGSQLFEEADQVAFMQGLESRLDKDQLHMLVLVSLVAAAKMEKYGIERLPTAIQIDRDGTVVRRVTGADEIGEYLRW